MLFYVIVGLFAVVFPLLAWLLFRLATWSVSASVDLVADGKPVLVTGAASGIGKSVVEVLLKNGCFVFAGDINEAALQQLWRDNPNVRTLKIDVTKQADVDAARRAVESEGRGLYGVVNSAGIAMYPGGQVGVGRSVLEWDTDTEVRPLIEVNLLGTMRVNHAFFEPIVHSKGCIVNIASVAGRLSTPGLGAYVASKHGVAGYSGTIRKELRPYNTRVVCVEPSWTRTNMTEPLTAFKKFDVTRTKLPRTFEGSQRAIERTKSWDPRNWITPEVVADVIFRALFSSKITNPHILVDRPVSKAIFTVISFLPHAWFDAILAHWSR